MYLYVQVYGLTHLRVYVLWLLVVLTVWTVLLTAGLFKTGIPFFRIITIFVTVWYLMLAYSLPDIWIAAYDLTLPKVPHEFLMHEVYPDAAQVIKDDGHVWEEYVTWNDNLVDVYNRKNALEKIREYNYFEYKAVKLMSDK